MQVHTRTLISRVRRKYSLPGQPPKRCRHQCKVAVAILLCLRARDLGTEPDARNWPESMLSLVHYQSQFDVQAKVTWPYGLSSIRYRFSRKITRHGIDQVLCTILNGQDCSLHRPSLGDPVTALDTCNSSLLCSPLATLQRAECTPCNATVRLSPGPSQLKLSRSQWTSGLFKESQCFGLDSTDEDMRETRQ